MINLVGSVVCYKLFGVATIFKVQPLLLALMALGLLLVVLIGARGYDYVALDCSLAGRS